MKISTLLNTIKTKSKHNFDADIEIQNIAFDSRQIEKDTLFVAQKGTQTDGHQYISLAIEKGATAIVCQTLPSVLNEKICYIEVENSDQTLGRLAANFYENPSTKLKLIGITGTNGKTTIATLLFELFRNLGYKAGLLSTVQNKINDTNIPSTHTTPDALAVNQLIKKMVDLGCQFAFMEVSSHAAAQHRIEGLCFEGGIFTNLTLDHLDFHKTFLHYLAAKQSFFDRLPKHAFALTNADDKNGSIMLQNTKAKKYTYALQTSANYTAKVLENNFEGLLLSIDQQTVNFKLVGSFNAYNLLAIYGAAVLLGENKEQILIELSNLGSVVGRFDYFRNPQTHVVGIVDYAHTPDALENVLKTIQNIVNNDKATANQRKMITVVGCGGNRDTSKRPIMTQIACLYSHKIILTSDNPRHEDPESILDDMTAGISPQNKFKTTRIADRKEAIKTAFLLAQKGDIVLVAGKGHETYQEIKGIKHPFDDREMVKEILFNSN